MPAKEEATVYVRESDLFVTVMRLGNSPAVLSLTKLCEDLGTGTIGRVAGNHISSRKAIKFIATRQIMYHSSYLVCPRAQEIVTDTAVPATRRSESAGGDPSARGNSWHEPTEIENPNQNDDEELQDDELQSVPDWLQEFKEGLFLMKVLQNTETLTILPMSYLQSREQKWYRVIIVSLLTSRRTAIAISA